VNNIQGTAKVWLPDADRITPRDIQQCINDGKTDYAIRQFSYSGLDADMSKYGWVEIGTATIDVTFLPQESVIEKLADGLREQISIVRAEAQSKVAQLEDKLNQLLALPAPDQGEAA
jgi:hypothetical protein